MFESFFFGFDVGSSPVDREKSIEPFLFSVSTVSTGGGISFLSRRRLFDKWDGAETSEAIFRRCRFEVLKLRSSSSTSAWNNFSQATVFSNPDFRPRDQAAAKEG